MSAQTTILIATRNENKFNEINELLSDLPFRYVSLIEMEADLDSKENGQTYEANAVGKARQGSQKFQIVCIGEDSGLEVEALARKPGIRSARFAGEEADDRDNNRKLLKELNKHKIPLENRKARFVSVLSLATPDGRVFSSTGSVEGMILNRSRGKNGFGYDPLFYFPEFKKTFAQMTLAEKNRLSHRARAAEGIKKYLRKLA